MIFIDIFVLLDRLEKVINDAQNVPFTQKRMVDEQDVFEIIDQIKQVVPQEIRDAKRLTVDRDRITGEAQNEAQRIVDEAHDERDQMLSDQGLLESAEERRREIIDEAQVEAESIRLGANEYVLDLLEALDVRLTELQRQVGNGIETIRQVVDGE